MSRFDAAKYPVLNWLIAVEPDEVRAAKEITSRFENGFELREAARKELKALMADCKRCDGAGQTNACPPHTTLCVFCHGPGVAR